MESDQEIVQLVGAEEMFFTGLAPSLEESTKHKIYTQAQALEYLGSQIKSTTKKPTSSRGRTKPEEAKDILAGVVLNHIPVNNYDFRMKCIYMALMIRRIIMVQNDPSTMDDKDYYGNKRLEL